MSSSYSRRRFIIGLGAVAAASSVQAGILAQDRGDFKKPPKRAPPKLTWGYAAITWGGNDVQAIKDISEVGFRGIQLRSNVLNEFGGRPKALRDLLAEYHLEMVALSSGNVSIAPGREKEEIDKHVRNAAFVRDVGGHYLQVIDAARPKNRKPTADDFKQLGRLMTEIGKRTIDFGVPLGYHHHMKSLGENPDEVDRVMEASDPRYVKLELDVAHYQQGGGDPVKAIMRYHDRLLFLHIKDVESPLTGTGDDAPRAYRFVELGRGKVDLPAVFAALTTVNFRGWAVVELDSVPDKARTPKESAMISKRYLEERLGIRI
jgi:inosose dehydratase